MTTRPYIMESNTTMDFDVEEALYQLDDYDNMTQLQMLNQEIQHIMDHGIQPPQEWFEMRFQKVYQYSELNWTKLIYQFQNMNEYISDTCRNIVKMIQEIMDEWAVSPVFNLSTYYQLIYDMDNVITTYQTQYIGKETDEDMADLILSMTQL